MATMEVTSQQANITKQSYAHPLSPLTASEIKNSAELIRGQWPSNIDLRFKVITLQEPAKKSMVPYLDAEHSGNPLPEISRKSFVAYYIRNTVSPPVHLLSLYRADFFVDKDKFHEAIVDLTQQRVESNVRLGANQHGPGDYDEIVSVERIALEDPGVKAEIEKLQLPQGAVVCADPWIYGTSTCHCPCSHVLITDRF